jgi:N-acetylglucosamine-6-phosphate deacetylase
VLPAHLESNFIHPDWAGAQPRAHLRLPPGAATAAGLEDYRADGILAEIARAAADVGIVTLAPELPGALDLVARLVAAGHRVSLGHSGATFDQATAAVRAGASRATHLFNRMSPFGHREPGLVGAALHHDELAVEIVCDGVHVHPAAVALAVAAKGPARAMAITDGTAGSGLAPGSRAALGGRPITARDAAWLDDGTLAGSVLTMDRAFAFLTGPVGLGLVEAAQLVATTPARDLGLQGHGVIAAGAVADLVVLDRRLNVVETYVGGRRVYMRETS